MSEPDLPALQWPVSHDPVGEALHVLRMDGVFYSRSELRAPFGLALPPMPDCLMFHVMLEGQCQLFTDTRQIRLGAGDFALLPHGVGHRLADSPDSACIGLAAAPRRLLGDRYESLQLGGQGAQALLLCGAVHFRQPAAQRLLALLPEIIVLDARSMPEPGWIEGTVRVIANEAQRARPGGEAVLTRLADILVIQAIRQWLQDSSSEHGWLAALKDRQIGQAMALMHRSPGDDWSVDALARAVAMSRSAFAARFTQLVGMPAMHYLTTLRMQQAQQELRNPESSLASIAERLGYQSEAAFSRAFKRHTGLTPGSVRIR